MASTYSGDPSASPADRVRFLLGDTAANDMLLSDGEVAYLLDQASGDAMRAAIAGCYAILARLSPNVDETVGSVSVTVSQRRANYTSLLSSLMSQSATGTGLTYRAYAGGTSYADKAANDCDTDRVAPFFRRRSEGTTWYDARVGGLPRGVPGAYDDGAP